MSNIGIGKIWILEKWGESMDWVKVGNQIRKYRKAKGWTQEQLAEAVEKTAKHIGNLENAKTQMSLECCVDISRALNISPNQLLVDNLREDVQKEILDEELIELYHSCPVRQRKKFLRYLQLFLECEQESE